MNLIDNQDSNNELDIKSILEKYSIHWKWFILSLLFFLFIAFYKLNFTRNEYEAVATIKLKDEKGSDKSALSAFQDLGFINPSKENIEDEIEILKSKSLISETLKSLNFNVSLFTNKNYISDFLDETIGASTNFYEHENYTDNPIKINFFSNDSIIYKTSNQFRIKVISPTKFMFVDLENNINKKSEFGKRLTTSFGDIMIVPNINLKPNEIVGKDILVSITSMKRLTELYLLKLKIEAKSEFSNVLTLSVNDGVRKKAEDFLNMLVQKYNERAITLKEELSKNTSNLVSKRLEMISKELTNVDLTAEDLKTQFKISDLASDAALNIQTDQELQNQIASTNTELQKIEYVKDLLDSGDKKNTAPINIGIQNNNISVLTDEYNKLVMEKKRLLKNSTEKNPTVVNINDQLKSINSSIKEGLRNLESSQKITLNGLTNQASRIKYKINTAPKQEREYRNVQRQQQIKEQLYLYLLQKREETAITLGVSEPNAKIIDIAESLLNPVSPKKGITYIGFALFGLFLPALFIYARNLLDTKIHSKEDVEKLLNIPIIGDIPKLDNSKNKYIISKDDHSSIAEAFRILRTNLGFLLNRADKEIGKTIFISSTIAHEGKSLVASNLSASLALAGKKTLLLGMDIRAPKIKDYLNPKDSHLGVTNYIVNKDISVEDLIINVPEFNNLDIIYSGDIPPNPSELLLNDRVKMLFESIQRKYEYIIVDTAASGVITDTMVIKDYADALIYIIRANYIDKRQLSFVKNIYKEKRYKNMALLINGVDEKKGGYGYGYGYGENHKMVSSNGKKWWNK